LPIPVHNEGQLFVIIVAGNAGASYASTPTMRVALDKLAISISKPALQMSCESVL